MNSSSIYVRQLIALLLIFLSSGCTAGLERWEHARKTEIDPINGALHRHLAADIEGHDRAAILARYENTSGRGLIWGTPELVSSNSSETLWRWTERGEEKMPDRIDALLGTFVTMDKAEVRIHRVHWKKKDARGYPADVRFVVRGTGPDGHKRILSQRVRLHLAARGPDFVITDEEVLERELIEAAQPHFHLATAAAKIVDTHDISGSPTFRLIGDMAAASGSAIGDFNCDGYEDFALLSTTHLRLYRNNADGSFADVTAASGLGGDLPIAGAGLVFFDADNDGDPDLFVAGLKGDRFFVNQECSRFEDHSATAGLHEAAWSSMPLVADYDADGFLDVYVVRMGDHQKTAPEPNWDARNGVRDTLYRNLGDGTFIDETERAGIAERGWGLAGAWADYDSDGDPDLYVGNEFGFNALYENQGDGTFIDVAERAGVLDRGAAMGIAWGDYDGDGHPDLYVSNMYANSGWSMFHPDYPSPLPWYLAWVPRNAVDEITAELTRGSTLLRNRGDGTFDDTSMKARVRDAQWGWAAEFLDYDNDGQLDIYAVNGFISGPLPGDV
ncbi:MAG: VCBS repeat-containing protein [bacterium]